MTTSLAQPSGATGNQSPIRLGISGASGRLGQALLEAIVHEPSWQLTAAWVAGDDPKRGQETGLAGVRYTALPDANLPDSCIDPANPTYPQVVVDFSSPSALKPLLATLRHWNVPLVSGTTGLGADELAALREASTDIPVLWAPNFSLTVQLMQDFLARLGRVHGDSWQARIDETHRAGKKDAPSGTALALAQALTGSGSDQAGTAANALEKITDLTFALGPVSMQSHRVGQVAGIHEVKITTPGETLILRHEAENPALFARSALQVARWLVQQPAKLYDLKDYIQSVAPRKLV